MENGCKNKSTYFCSTLQHVHMPPMGLYLQATEKRVKREMICCINFSIDTHEKWAIFSLWSLLEVILLLHAICLLKIVRQSEWRDPNWIKNEPKKEGNSGPWNFDRPWIIVKTSLKINELTHTREVAVERTQLWKAHSILWLCSGDVSKIAFLLYHVILLAIRLQVLGRDKWIIIMIYTLVTLHISSFSSFSS